MEAALKQQKTELAAVEAEVTVPSFRPAATESALASSSIAVTIIMTLRKKKQPGRKISM